MFMSHYFASASAVINHSLNPAQRLFCGGTQRNTAKRLYTSWHTVRGRSHWSQWQNAARNTYMRVYNCAKDHKMRLMQLFPLSLHSHGMRATHLFVWKVLQGCCQKTVQGNSFGTTGDAVPHWPRLDVCWPRLARNLTVEGCFARDWLAAGRFAGTASGRKGSIVFGSVLFSGRRGCVDQADDVLFSFTSATML